MKSMSDMHPFGVKGVTRCLSELDPGKITSGTKSFPLNLEWKNTNLKCDEDDPGEWFVRIVREASKMSSIQDLEVRSVIESCQLAKGLAAFASLSWKRGAITYLSMQVFATPGISLENYFDGGECLIDGKPAVPRYYRLDFSPSERGNLFDHPFPHIHSIPDGSPRFPWTFSPSVFPALSFLEFVIANHQYDSWKQWLIEVPRRIRKEAEAKADAALIEAESRIQIGEIERRALTRFVVEQTREQKNIEEITTKALTSLDPGSDPSRMDEDWISDFFSKCRRVSNDEMQALWANLLAGEANLPGSVSRRTVDFVAAMDRTEAEIFSRLCRFSSNSLNNPLIFDTSHQILADNGIEWRDLSHMDTIGLIQLASVTGFVAFGLPEHVQIVVAGEVLELTLKEQDGKRQIEIGRVMLTKIGLELRRFVHFEAPAGFYDYCVEHWAKNMNCTLSSRYPRIQTR